VTDKWLAPTLAAVVYFSASPASAAEYAAVLQWSGRVDLTFPVSGVIDAVTARPGQRVGKGELLANLEPTVFKAGVAESRADLDRLGEEHADAKRELERVRELYARTVATTTELDAARLRLARVQSSLAAAQARIERARRLLSESELRAPFDALILSRPGEPGMVISSQCQPAIVYSVARGDELIALARLEPGPAGSLRPGGEAEVVVGEKPVKGRISGLSALPDGRYGLEVLIPRGAGMLAGQPASIRLP